MGDALFGILFMVGIALVPVGLYYGLWDGRDDG